IDFESARIILKGLGGHIGRRGFLRRGCGHKRSDGRKKRAREENCYSRGKTPRKRFAPRESPMIQADFLRPHVVHALSPKRTRTPVAGEREVSKMWRKFPTNFRLLLACT